MLLLLSFTARKWFHIKYNFTKNPEYVLKIGLFCNSASCFFAFALFAGETKLLPEQCIGNNSSSEVSILYPVELKFHQFLLS